MEAISKSSRPLYNLNLRIFFISFKYLIWTFIVISIKSCSKLVADRPLKNLNRIFFHLTKADPGRCRHHLLSYRLTYNNKNKTNRHNKNKNKENYFTQDQGCKSRGQGLGNSVLHVPHQLYKAWTREGEEEDGVTDYWCYLPKYDALPQSDREGLQHFVDRHNH